ncbi:hypothetical protein INT48_003708 [Thamnidium elegans]|uniref:DHHA2 domain-containing protein n=1 Tax=Thamnidium elegans TaxID=101142 RepID=A0A8H7SLX6_9FUNG|nr:hypothetical protein INT48_003708 [Thamnidium elegans]
MNSLDQYLEYVRKELSNQTTHKVIVSGNDSADLDSIISSLIFAYLSYTQQKDTNTLFVPLVKVPKADLELRPELNFVLKQVGLDYKKLITIDQIDTSQPTHIVLIDHNQLTVPFHTEAWANHVVGILDHHVDEKLYLNVPIRVVDMVGSCVTLVLKHFKVSVSAPWLTEDIARLSMAPLLVDTVNLKWDLGRTTESDVQVFNVLKEKVQSMEFNSFFKSIEKVKSEVDTMANYDILRRDYKEFPNVNGYKIGTSAVTWNFRAWAERENGTESISKAAIDYAHERGLDMEVIFTAFDYDREEVRGGDYRRELAVFVINKDLDRVKTSLENNKDLQLKRIEFDGSNEYYDQGNIKMSRKQVWPLLKKLIETHDDL